MQTSQKDPAPQEGAASSAVASLAILTLITAHHHRPCNSPVCHTARSGTEELQLSTVKLNKGAPLNVPPCSRKWEVQQKQSNLSHDALYH